VALLAVKMATKLIGVWPTSRAFQLPTREANYTSLLMSTGLTFGTISALFGLTNGLIDQTEYTILVTVVILSAIVPTLIAQAFFRPEIAVEVRRLVGTPAAASTSGQPRAETEPVATRP